MINYCNPEGFKNEIRSLKEANDPDKFFSWFDGGGTIKGAFVKGEDVFNRMFLPYAKKYLRTLDDKTCLDIGYGGGTKMIVACKYFKTSWGIDVHKECNYIGEEFEKTKFNNYRFFETDGDHLNYIEDQSVDFIYSWVTFLHLMGIENVEKYLSEIHRVLKPGGIAVIYFTRLIRSKTKQNESEYQADIVKENQHTDGFRYGGPLTKVRRIGMVISLWKMAELAEKAGLIIVDKTVSHDGKGKNKVIHGQHGIVLQKYKGSTTSESSWGSSTKTTPSKSRPKRSLKTRSKKLKK